MEAICLWFLIFVFLGSPCSLGNISTGCTDLSRVLDCFYSGVQGLLFLQPWSPALAAACCIFFPFIFLAPGCCVLLLPCHCSEPHVHPRSIALRLMSTPCDRCRGVTSPLRFSFHSIYKLLLQKFSCCSVSSPK